ncbi:unnamed protein product [Mytilus edulis]|uniref:Uncharacterized protein n=1 Tax=Mytilus edulis TaxID=6550 RepID=A0A8S3RXS8_MYTED|nr:unnamed protein product [Mytilus edulis]
MDIMGNLYDKYKHRNEIQNLKKTTKEMEKIEEEFTDAENECREHLIESKVASSVGSSVSRISKRDNVNSENKVESEALQVIENLGQSAAAYDAAKKRLERKYGGQQRQIILYIEELENCKPMREEIEDRNDLDNIVRKFWEIENVKTPSENVFLSNDEQKALSKVEQSLEFKDGHYEVKVPWKDDTPSLPNNYNMALSRLANTEKRLNKDPSIANVYTQTIKKIN